MSSRSSLHRFLPNLPKLTHPLTTLPESLLTMSNLLNAIKVRLANPVTLAQLLGKKVNVEEELDSSKYKGFYGVKDSSGVANRCLHWFTQEKTSFGMFLSTIVTPFLERKLTSLLILLTWTCSLLFNPFEGKRFQHMKTRPAYSDSYLQAPSRAPRRLLDFRPILPVLRLGKPYTLDHAPTITSYPPCCSRSPASIE